jgi:hypothetical protein
MAVGHALCATSAPRVDALAALLYLICTVYCGMSVSVVVVMVVVNLLASVKCYLILPSAAPRSSRFPSLPSLTLFAVNARPSCGIMSPWPVAAFKQGENGPAVPAAARRSMMRIRR